MCRLISHKDTVSTCKDKKRKITSSGPVHLTLHVLHWGSNLNVNPLDPRQALLQQRCKVLHNDCVSLCKVYHCSNVWDLGFSFTGECSLATLMPIKDLVIYQKCINIPSPVVLTIPYPLPVWWHGSRPVRGV